MITWVLIIVWYCHSENAAECVGIYGPYPTLEACKAANPSIQTPLVGRRCTNELSAQQEGGK